MSVKMEPRMNRTGITIQPDLTKEMLAGVREFPPTTPGSSASLMTIREAYLGDGEPIGSIPLPPKGAATEKSTMIFTDKLGERLAFERTGARLYEAFLGKLAGVRSRGSTVPVKDVEEILRDEWEHFLIVRQAIEGLGGDPTAVTPAADIAGVASSGIVQVLTDPRTTVDECLCALLTAELTDNDGWQLLVTLAESLGHKELGRAFNAALTAEERHLTMVRGWVEAGTLPSNGARVKAKGKAQPRSRKS
jgi:hypothetical protein